MIDTNGTEWMQFDFNGSPIHNGMIDTKVPTPDL